MGRTSVLDMAVSVASAPAGLARRDLRAGQAIGLACAALAFVTALDVVTDGRLGLVFSVGFVLTVATIPLAVDVRSLLPAGVLPPILLVVAIGTVTALAPGAVRVEGLPADTGWFGHTLTGVVDHGVQLLIGHGVALLLVVVRVLTDPGSSRSRVSR